MDVAYPVGPVRPDPDPLVWSLRTLQHVPHDRVFLAGGISRGVDPAKVVHLPTKRMKKWSSIYTNLRAVLDSDISEDFIWMNDDFFILRDVDEIPLHHRGTIDAYSKYLTHGNEFQRGMASQAAILGEWGFPLDTPNTDLHAPQVVNKTRLNDILERAAATNPDHPLGHFRMLYGAGLASTWLKDPKISRADRLPPLSWPYASTDVPSWGGQTGDYIRLRYHERSPYEKHRTQPTFRRSPMATFRNIATGQILELQPNDPRYGRLARMTHRWERLDSGADSSGGDEPVTLQDDTRHVVDTTETVAVILEKVGSDAALAQAVMEAEAAKDKPRSTLMAALAEIVTGGVGEEE